MLLSSSGPGHCSFKAGTRVRTSLRVLKISLSSNGLGHVDFQFTDVDSTSTGDARILLSSSGPGHCPFKARTRVQIPLRVPKYPFHIIFNTNLNLAILLFLYLRILTTFLFLMNFVSLNRHCFVLIYRLIDLMSEFDSKFRGTLF